MIEDLAVDLALYESLSAKQTNTVLLEERVNTPAFSDFLWNFPDNKMNMKVILFLIFVTLKALDKYKQKHKTCNFGERNILCLIILSTKNNTF